MSIWNDLTQRHKLYASLALLFGLLLGLVTITTMVVLVAVSCGFVLSLTGAGILLVKKDPRENTKFYITWRIIAITCLIAGLTCFLGAVIGLYMHQQGVI